MQIALIIISIISGILWFIVSIPSIMNRQISKEDIEYWNE